MSKINRREARETVVGLLFEKEFRPEEDANAVYALAIEGREIPTNDYVNRVFFGVCDNLEKIDAVITAHSKGWSPGDFGDPAEDCNCRCALLQKAKWTLDEDETKYLGKIDNLSDAELNPLAEKLHISVDELRGYSGQIIPVRAKNYEDFKRQYNQIYVMNTGTENYR